MGSVLHINVQRFRGGLVFKAVRLCESLNSRLESNKEEEEGLGWWVLDLRGRIALPRLLDLHFRVDYSLRFAAHLQRRGVLWTPCKKCGLGF